MLLRVIYEIALSVAVVYGVYCIVYNLANGIYRRYERRFFLRNEKNTDSSDSSEELEGSEEHDDDSDDLQNS